jgi:hypothetical protein
MIKGPKGRSARFALAGALAVGVLTAFAAVAGVGVTQNAAGAGEYQYGQPKVTICHHTHSTKHPFVTITVGAPAAAAHLKHHDGDHLGACTAAELAKGKHNNGKHKGQNKSNHASHPSKPSHPSHPSKPSKPSGASTPSTPSGNGNNGSNGKGHGK